MNIKLQLHIVTLFLISLSIGCGGNSTVTGKVTFADGTPMDIGEVVFETDTMAARGEIQKDGTYTLSTGEAKGVPRGTYRVCISGFKATIVSSPPAPGARPGPPRISAPVIPIHEKFLSTTTSGLTCEVKGRTKYDITVEPPER